MQTEQTFERDLSPARAEEIRRLQEAAFPGTPEFRVQRWYHTPEAGDDLWFGARREGRLIGSARLVHRRIDTVGRALDVGGIANVCSHPDARGQGAAAACMEAAQRYIASGGRVDFGLLFCSEARGFYEKLGWRTVENPLYIRDPHGDRQRTHASPTEYAMIFPGRQGFEQWPDGAIDLNGMDW